MNKFKLAIVFIVGFISQSCFAVSFELVATKPICNHAGHQNSWCEASDVPASVASAGLEEKILNQLEPTLLHSAQAHVQIAMFSFSNKTVQAKLCELGKNGVRVDIFVDFGSAKDVAFTQNTNCQKDPAQPTLNAKFLGGFNEFPNWRLHHNKTMIVDLGDGSDLQLDFSSGNLSNFGTSIHWDHWVMMQTSSDSNIAKASLCLFEGLDQAHERAVMLGMYAAAKPDFSKDKEVVGVFQSALNDCYTRDQVIAIKDWSQALLKEEIAPLFTPMRGNFVIRALREQIANVNAQYARDGHAYIYATSDHFTIKEIGKLLVESAELGVDVRVLLPSSLLSGSEGGIQDRILYYRTLKPSKVKVQFVEVNEPGQQHLHNKFMVFNGQRVFSGAGNFTNAGLSGNFESLYLTQNSALTARYELLFNDLWALSLSERAVPR